MKRTLWVKSGRSYRVCPVAHYLRESIYYGSHIFIMFLQNLYIIQPFSDISYQLAKPGRGYSPYYWLIWLALERLAWFVSGPNEPRR